MSDECTTMSENKQAVDNSTGTLLPHQQRVVDELRALIAKILSLADFRQTEVCKALDPAEQVRLHTQQAYMAGYAEILCKRIEAFRRG